MNPEMTSLRIQSPVGDVILSGNSTMLSGIAIMRPDQHPGARWLDGTEPPLLQEAARQIAAFFAGQQPDFDLPLMPAATAFQNRLRDVMRAIPYGDVRTYADLARATDSAPRAVGGGCRSNAFPIIVPCHRVLATKGLGGYSGAKGLETKRQLLAIEGWDGGAGTGLSAVGAPG